MSVEPAPSPAWLVIDLEATCDEGDGLAPSEMEIIEIGAAWATVHGEVIDGFQAFVRPVLHPHLTTFCQRLTGISQQQVDDAETFAVAATRLAAFAQKYPCATPTWASWGQFDARQLLRDSERHGVPHPLDGFEHVNLKRCFAKRRKIKEVGMNRALMMAGLEAQGQHHRALDDARNISHLLPWALGCA